MSEFVGDFWGAYLTVITLASLVACGALVPLRLPRPDATGKEGIRQ